MKLRNTRIVAALATLALTLSACSSSNDTSLSSGDARIVWSHAKVAGITTSNFLLTLAATLLPPTINGTTLTANAVQISGTNALVSYNYPGANHMGALDLLSVAVPALPVRTASLSFPTSTVNGAYQYNSTIYTVGAVNDPSTVASGWPAVLSTLSLSGSTLYSTNTIPLQQTYAGTGVTAWNGKLYAISGGAGASVSQGVSVMDPSSLGFAATVPIVEPRDLGYYYGGTGNLFVVSGNAGNGGQLIEINSSNTVVRTTNIGGNVTPESKSTVQVGKTMVAVSKSEGGVAIVCQADGTILKAIPAPTGVPGFTNAQTVSNAVAAGPGLLFVANGEAGVYVYTMTKSAPAPGVACNSVTTNLIGTIDLGNATYSANNVTYVAGSLFVATGLGGFKVITVTVLAPLLNGNLDFM